MVNFKDYTECHYHVLLEMIHALYNEDPEGEPIDEVKISKTINEFRKNPQKLTIKMFMLNDEVIGYAILVYYWSNEYGGNILSVDELYIKEGYRNKGIGTSFLNTIAERKDIVALQIETTPSNEKAFIYYKGLGFTPSKNNHLIKRKKIV